MRQVAERGAMRVMRQRTVVPISGRGEEDAVVEGVSAGWMDCVGGWKRDVVGRRTLSRGTGLDLLELEDLVVDEDEDVLLLLEGGGMDDEATTGPAIEAYTWESWTCVPGPGR